ncbi:hypothetical protein MTR67_000272 [Solanum verrucosum]|uniref:Lipoxygenase domain-containing protein n=1 Tax=Solanum verrucosum TaxID=315347 RepID=A0AAF0PM83_SOLVR|nr:hypothetical protein MTR67_000272 [Solanum verrucosum]
MEINALAREALINANGIIESSFFLGKYAIELSSIAYGAEWRFDHEALPQNLISRPTIARSKMPTEDPTAEEWEWFMNKPEEALLRCFPEQIQATKVMAILDVLSNHSPDEEHIGEKIEPYWAEDPIINAVVRGVFGEMEGA